MPGADSLRDVLALLGGYITVDDIGNDALGPEVLVAGRGQVAPPRICRFPGLRSSGQRRSLCQVFDPAKHNVPGVGRPYRQSRCMAVAYRGRRL